MSPFWFAIGPYHFYSSGDTLEWVVKAWEEEEYRELGLF